MPACTGATVATETAAAAGAAGSATAAGGLMTWLFPILLIVIFIVMIIVPNRNREKKFKEMMDSIKIGDHIKTIGGFYGKVVSLKDELVTIECGPDKTRLVLSKSAIASVESFEDGAEIPQKNG